jgi:deazaflavin-dependent oxidoreductase (nitroreductase family)
MSERNQRVIEEFRANDGRVGGVWANCRLLILHTTGAKSGQEHVNPLVTFEDNGRLVIAASKGGAPSHPDWYHNILANPIVEVEYGTERFRARAEVTGEPERTRLYERMKQQLASFAGYPEKASPRVIPVITLERLD